MDQNECTMGKYYKSEYLHKENKHVCCFFASMLICRNPTSAYLKTHDDFHTEIRTFLKYCQSGFRSLSKVKTCDKKYWKQLSDWPPFSKFKGTLENFDIKGFRQKLA